MRYKRGMKERANASSFDWDSMEDTFKNIYTSEISEVGRTRR